MPVLIKNNANSLLAAAINSSVTALSVTTGEGAKFPSPGAGEWFPLTLIKASGVLEILRCTARSGDVFTVTRGQESTAAAAFSAGDRVELRLTQAAVEEFFQSNDFSAFILTLLNDADAATARTTLGAQASDATLTALAALTTAANQMIYSTGVDAFAMTALSAFARTLLDDADAADARTTLGAFSSAGGTLSGALNESPVTTIASAATVNIGAATSNTINISGTTTITSLGTIDAGAKRTLVFQGALTLTHNATSLILPGGASITTAAGDVAEFVSLGSGNWKCTNYEKANGQPIAGASTADQLCTAWVNFNGTGTVAIRESYNVSSITDNGVGDYTVNFETSMNNANFTYHVNSSTGGNSFWSLNSTGGDDGQNAAPTINSARFSNDSVGGTAGSDPVWVYATFHGGK